MENNWLNRTENLIGKVALNKIKASNILIVGIGGVGSFCTEALIRSGIENITLIDNDVVDITNINRQLIADTTTINKPKVQIMKERILKINPNAKVNIFQEFLNDINMENLVSNNFDYVIDCIDSIKSKICLIKYCNNHNIKILSSMGTGNKLDPTKFEINDIYKTSVCPLAKIIRKELKKLEIKELKVLYSKELPKNISNSNTPASIAFVPSTAGLIIASEVIKDLISN